MLVGVAELFCCYRIEEAAAVFVERQHERLRAGAEQLRKSARKANHALLEIDGVRAHRDQLVSAVEEAR
jgi:hypothetical protein